MLSSFWVTFAAVPTIRVNTLLLNTTTAHFRQRPIKSSVSGVDPRSSFLAVSNNNNNSNEGHLLFSPDDARHQEKTVKNDTTIPCTPAGAEFVTVHPKGRFVIIFIYCKLSQGNLSRHRFYQWPSFRSVRKKKL